MYKKPKMCEDQKRVWGIKAVAGSYLGLLSSVSILSAHRTIIRPILWPAAFYASAAVYHLKISDLVHTPAGPVGHLIKTDICIFAILVCTQTIVHTVTILVWTNYFSRSANRYWCTQTIVHTEPITFWHITICGQRKWTLISCLTILWLTICLCWRRFSLLYKLP